MKLLFKCFFFLNAFAVFSQEAKYPPPMIAVDSLYREDQFYIGFTYDLLINGPTDFSQNKFSSGFTGGVLRDMPVNKSRTVAIAAGLGLSYNKYFQNLYITQPNQTTEYAIVPAGMPYNKDKFEQLFVDVPIEFRWRTSTPESHEFWRIYTGLKLSYLIADKYVFIPNDGGSTIIKKNDDVNDFQAGVYLAFGYNTWNFYAYYGLIPIFKSSATINGDTVGLNTVNLGLMFYIL